MIRYVFSVFLIASGVLLAEEEIPFEEIKPILRDKCSHCHNRKTLEKQGSFESAKLAFVKSEAGVPYIVPGKPDESLIVVAMESPELHEKAMPMVGPRPTEEDIAKIRAWITQGAKWPKGKAGKIKPPFYNKE